VEIISRCENLRIFRNFQVIFSVLAVLSSPPNIYLSYLVPVLSFSNLFYTARMRIVRGPSLSLVTSSHVAVAKHVPLLTTKY
jgi:hypothetical protein